MSSRRNKPLGPPPSERRKSRGLKPGLDGLEDRIVMSADFRSMLPPAQFAQRVLPPAIQSLDGTGNNLQNPGWGSTGATLLRVGPLAYGDGVASPAGSDRPSARTVSNAVSAQPTDTAVNDRNLTALVYAWGQFLDHDLDLTDSAIPRVAFDIPVPTDDPLFDPESTGTQVISFGRAESVDGTGTSTDNALAHGNEVTAFLDGSMIYGTDAERASALRTFQGGMLKTSEGDLLPGNTEGLANDRLPGPLADEDYFLAGDRRANENIELTALHTLFAREHNRIAAELAIADPSLSDEALYQQARRQVIAELQAITYNEFLPALLGENTLGPYRGYDPTVNPGIAAEFSTAAYRIGHTMVGDDVEFLDNEGEEIREALPLSEAFFNPNVLRESGIDSILKYLAVDNAQEVDTKVVDGLRNMLFGAPGSGGLDLAAINTQRGRDLGLSDYNTTRVAYGLNAVTSFSEITSDPELRQILESLYGTVDNIDLWVGGLAEDHLSGSSVGETFTRIMVDQFNRLRAGDQYWYENLYQGKALDTINNTTLAHIIERNTSLTNLQTNVFYDPSVLYYKTPEGRQPGDLTVEVAGDTIRVSDSRTGATLAQNLVAETSQLIVLGRRGGDDRMTLEIANASALPAGGMTVLGGRGGRDELIVSGSDQGDQMQLVPQAVSVNGLSAATGGFSRVTLNGGSGDDVIDVAPSRSGPEVIVHGGAGKDTVTGAPDRDLPPPPPPERPQSPGPSQPVRSQQSPPPSGRQSGDPQKIAPRGSDTVPPSTKAQDETANANSGPRVAPVVVPGGPRAAFVQSRAPRRALDQNSAGASAGSRRQSVPTTRPPQSSVSPWLQALRRRLRGGDPPAGTGNQPS